MWLKFCCKIVLGYYYCINLGPLLSISIIHKILIVTHVEVTIYLTISVEELYLQQQEVEVGG